MFRIIVLIGEQTFSLLSYKIVSGSFLVVTFTVIHFCYGNNEKSGRKSESAFIMSFIFFEDRKT